MHLAAGAHQLRGNVRLQVGEAEYEVGLEREDAVNLGAGEGRYPRLLAPRPRRADGEAGNADDAPVLAQQVERFGGLLGETDDA